MNFIDKVLQGLGYVPKNTISALPTQTVQELAAPNEKQALPTQGGRQSMPDYTNVFTLVQGDRMFVESDTPPEILKIIAHLVKHNADISHAVENIVALGDTAETITFDAGVPEKAAAQIIADIHERSKLWYAGGISNLRGDLLQQVATFGCVSAEIVLADNLKGVSKIVIVSPTGIKFEYDAAKASYLPYQHVTKSYLPIQYRANMLGTYIPLNPMTYKYVAVRRDGESPYAVPPFLSALESVVIEKDMLAGFKHVIKKLGILGFLHALVAAPKMLPNETPEAYQSRCSQYLSTMVVPELEKGLSKGVVAGFEGSHTFTVEGTNTNVSGAKELFNLITEMKMSGLKQDPRLLGRSFSTTETYGKVILAKFTSQIASYQRAIDDFMERVYMLECLLQGAKVKTVQVKSALPDVNDEAADQEALNKKITNYDLLYQQGVISQQQRAQALGYDKPFLEAPIVASTAPTNNNAANLQIDDVEAAAFEVSRGIAEYVYESDCKCGSKHDKFALSASFDKEASQLIEQYFGDVTEAYDKSAERMSKIVAAELAKLGEGATDDQVVNTIKYQLFKNWGLVFTAKQTSIIAKYIQAIYRMLRTDVGVFENWANFDPKNPPKAVFGVMDYRVIEYYQKSDSLYMGKFITDKDTQTALTKFIKEKYIEGGLPIGKTDAKSVALFRREFENLLKGEEWKLQRIINTTVNKMRNSANVLYMADANVTTYEILGVRDSLQCDWCKGMQGKQFTVTLAKNNVANFVNGSPEYVASLAPFLTKKFTAEEAKNTEASELQQLGYDLPPYHPNCRDVVKAVL